MGAHTWDIIKKKGKGLNVEIRIEKEEWEEIVENDPALMWWDDTQQGQVFYSDFGKDKPRKHSAVFEYIERTDKFTALFKYSSLTGEIWSYVSPINTKKAMKVFEIADKLGAKVYKLGREIIKEKVFKDKRVGRPRAMK
jgi:hypothetical protein